VKGPGERRADEEGEDRLTAHRLQHLVEQRCLAQRGRGLLDEGEGEQHEPQPDEDAAHVVGAKLVGP
jgi:hypothetical protein